MIDQCSCTCRNGILDCSDCAGSCKWSTWSEWSSCLTQVSKFSRPVKACINIFSRVINAMKTVSNIDFGHRLMNKQNVLAKAQKIDLA